MTNNPVMRVHKDFAKYLEERSKELDMGIVPVTKMLEISLKTGGGDKKDKEKDVKGFDLKTFK